MIITIAGLSGCGKNSVGQAVAKKLRLRLIDPTFKSMAEERRMDLMEFHRKAEKNHEIDREFDARLMKEAEAGDCVITTWLGPWMIINADLRIWLSASQHSRAVRVSSRDNMTHEQAIAHIAERDASNRTRYLDIYRIDIYDHSDFDLVINTEKYKPEQAADIIIEAAAAKLGRSIICERMENFEKIGKGKVKVGKKEAAAEARAAKKLQAKVKSKSKKKKSKR